jgi:hypothetical protein
VLQPAGAGGGEKPAGGVDGRGSGAKRQVEPMLEKIAALPEELGEVENLPADTGDFSADNVEACEKAGVVPVMNRAKCFSGSHSSTEGGSRYPVFRSIARKSLVQLSS